MIFCIYEENMNKPVRMITPALERAAFEKIITDVFAKYRDNLMCSQKILDEIVVDASKQVREQLQGLSRTYLTK